MTQQLLELEKLESITEVLRAIAHPIRLCIIDLLNEKEMNVSEIHEVLEIEQAVASHHLRIMKDRGVVNARRDGKNTFYALVDVRFYEILELMKRQLPD